MSIAKGAALLLAEKSATGRIALREFWIRRARWLFPALLSLMPAIAVYALVFARRDELAGIRGDALATLGYVANWRAILSHKSYLELFVAPSPLEHTGSLCIEEQFYLVWPVIVAVVLRLLGRRGLAAISILLAVLSIAAMGHPGRPSICGGRVEATREIGFVTCCTERLDAVVSRMAMMRLAPVAFLACWRGSPQR
ncbi:MAG: acyltransferase [Deltaproteobacteria bacterium]|nr:acyltransferase [Deltaproteobacteria bacterium]